MKTVFSLASDGLIERMTDLERSAKSSGMIEDETREDEEVNSFKFGEAIEEKK